MKRIYRLKYLIGLIIFLTGLSITSVLGQNFSQSNLQGASLINPTSLQFGPDGKLYVSQQDGTIKIFTINKLASNQYKVTNTESILLVKQIPNHYDDGTAKPYNQGSNKRQVTGIYVSGTSTNPIIYIGSSDNDIGAGDEGDVNLCTNSGIISKLYKEGTIWKKIDLVRGLPRSEENHSVNGIAKSGNTLYVTVGGLTNNGTPSNAWTYGCEFALSAAIISIDLAAIEAMPTKNDVTGKHPYKYDLPTLDDPTRTNTSPGEDINDPWGGNDGLNQAKIVPGGPVQLFATGFRNAYDVLITKTPGRANRMYTIDNGPNKNWGGWPLNEGASGNVTNQYDTKETGTTLVSNVDGFEYIGNLSTYNPQTDIYYGGHPNPIRSNPAGAGWYSDDGKNRGWRNDNSNPNLPLPSDWPPIPLSMANKEEGDFQDAGIDDKSLITFDNSTNGFCEYTASGVMQGDILATSFDGKIHRIRMNDAGQVLNTIGTNKLDQEKPLATGFGNKPLDIIAQGDGDIFPGTIWIAVWGGSAIAVLEPQSISGCTGADNSTLDEDKDGYKNADEINNGTNPCSGSSKPSDNDNDLVSDLNDTDDDNDGILDIKDFFALDAENGLETKLPTHYYLFNFDPGTGFFGLGFTGLMNNGVTDYMQQYNENNLIAGGAVGAFTIEEVPAGDASDGANNQQYGFQFGVNTENEESFTVRGAILPLYFDNETPKGSQSQGIFIGTGDQDNYIKIALNANGGLGGIEVVQEVNGKSTRSQYNLPGGIPNNAITFTISIDKQSGKASLFYSIDSKTHLLLSTITIGETLLASLNDPTKAMAVGIISTSKGAPTFNATWDYLEVFSGETFTVNQWQYGSISENILLYPNPGHDKIMINVSSQSQVKYQVSLYNNKGEKLSNYDTNWDSGVSNEMNISNLASGIYFLQFTTDDGKKNATVKFVKK